MLTIVAITSPLIGLLLPLRWQKWGLCALFIAWAIQFRMGGIGDYPHFSYGIGPFEFGINGWQSGFLFSIGLGFSLLKPHKKQLVPMAIAILLTLTAISSAALLLGTLVLLWSGQEKPWRWIAMGLGFGIAEIATQPIEELLALGFMWLPWMWPFYHSIGDKTQDLFCRPPMLASLALISLSMLPNAVAMGGPLFIGLNLAGAISGAALTWGSPLKRHEGLMQFWISSAFLGLVTQTYAGLDGAIFLLTLMPIGILFGLTTGKTFGFTGHVPALGYFSIALITLGAMGSIWRSGLVWASLFLLAWTAMMLRWTKPQAPLLKKPRWPSISLNLGFLLVVAVQPTYLLEPIQETTNQIMKHLKPAHAKLQKEAFPSWIFPKTKQPSKASSQENQNVPKP